MEVGMANQIKKTIETSKSELPDDVLDKVAGGKDLFRRDPQSLGDGDGSRSKE
jgi:hypothetical protein